MQATAAGQHRRASWKRLKRRPNESSQGADGRDQLALLRFIPSALVDQLARSSVMANFRDGKEPITAAFVFVDIYGLHDLPMCEERNAQILELVSSTFILIARIVRRHQGDLVKFTADGLLLLWEYQRDDADSARRATTSAARCALELMAYNGQPLWGAYGPVTLPVPEARAAPKNSSASDSDDSGGDGGGCHAAHVAARAPRRDPPRRRLRARPEMPRSRRRACLRRGRGPWRGAIVGASLALLATSRVQPQGLSASRRGLTPRGEAAERRARTLWFASQQQAESRSAASRSRTSDRPRQDERRREATREARREC